MATNVSRAVTVEVENCLVPGNHQRRTPFTAGVVLRAVTAVVILLSPEIISSAVLVEANVIAVLNTFTEKLN